MLSLRSRLAGTMALLFMVCTVILYFAAYAYARTAADRSFDRLLSGSALSIVETLVSSESGVDLDIPYAALDMLSAAPDDRVFYRVFDSLNATITGYADLPARLQQQTQRLIGDEPDHSLVTRPVFFDAPYRGDEVRFVLLARRIAGSGDDHAIWVQVGQTRRARESLARDLVVRAVVPLGLIITLALALVWFGIGRALRPLDSIGRDLLQREPSDLRPVAAPVPVEVAPLVDAINGFMARLKLSIDSLRSFVAEAAHQMRTPLAGLRAQAQLAAEDDPVQLRRSLESVERNAARLSRLLNQMLSDATIGHRSVERRFENLDLVELAHEAAHEAMPIESRHRAVFRTEIERAPFNGDSLMLAEAVKNLIENAVHHGAGDIEILVESDPDAYLISIADRGAGIAETDRARMFERFRRGAAGAGGAGLGLTIVRRAVEGHHGSVELLDRPGGGLIARIRLPREAE